VDFILTSYVKVSYLHLSRIFMASEASKEKQALQRETPPQKTLFGWDESPRGNSIVSID